VAKRAAVRRPERDRDVDRDDDDEPVSRRRRSSRKPSSRPGARSSGGSGTADAEQLNAVVRPFLSTIVELQQLGPERRPPAEVVHKQVRDVLEHTMRQASEAGLPSEFHQDLRFGLVAFADELMQLAPGRFQEFWTSHLLQEEDFHASLAGIEFYERLAQARPDHRRHPVLLVYYLCMLFGYRGQYRGANELGFENLLDDVRSDLQESMELSGSIDLAPLGDRPDEAAVDSRRSLLLQSLAVTVAVLSVLLYIGLWLVIDDEAVDVRETLQEQQRQLNN
jgi:type VI secretion system protein ImpK